MRINVKCFSEWSVAIEFALQLGTMIFWSAYSVTCLSDRKPVVSSYFLLQIETWKNTHYPQIFILCVNLPFYRSSVGDPCAKSPLSPLSLK